MRNKISYLHFHQHFSGYGIFSLSDIKKVYPDFDSRRLNEWQKKNYITKLIKGWYVFNDIKVGENLLFQISNSLRSPSYISLESALSYYNMIPEQVFTITAVSTLKTIEYLTPKANFTYQQIKPGIFFGYHILQQQKGRPVLIADKEKSILDFLYLNSTYNNKETMDSLRLNKIIIKNLDFEKMETYLKLFDNKALQNRYTLLKQIT